jgi:hypothetical protein
MTLRSRLPLQFSQKYFMAKDFLDSILSKIEVIINGRAIIYSIRMLIIVVALMMGYIHTPKNKDGLKRFDKMEYNGKKPDSIINVLN